MPPTRNLTKTKAWEIVDKQQCLLIEFENHKKTYDVGFFSWLVGYKDRFEMKVENLSSAVDEQEVILIQWPEPGEDGLPIKIEPWSKMRSRIPKLSFKEVYVHIHAFGGKHKFPKREQHNTTPKIKEF